MKSNKNERLAEVGEIHIPIRGLLVSACSALKALKQQTRQNSLSLYTHTHKHSHTQTTIVKKHGLHQFKYI